MGDEKDAFYVVRKGDIIGIYKSWSDCVAQAGSSVQDPSMSVYKGYGLTNEAAGFLASHGLKNAAYSINASYVNNDILGKLVPCPFQQPASPKEKMKDKDTPPKRSLEPDILLLGASGSTSVSTNPMSKHRKLDDSEVHQAVSSNCQSCVLEFDGASKGNPGQAGAGAVIRSGDGRVVYRLREGVGFATNNVAEYRSVILGMKHALHKGFKHIRVRGDSKLVCMQVLGLWKTKNQNMADLCKIAKELKSKFTSFEINHVDREFNSDADAQANIAVHLKDGQVQEAVATT